MFPFSKEKENKNNKEHIPYTENEQKLILQIENDFSYAESGRNNECYDNYTYTTEDEWEDEYKMWKGGGLQWLTKFAYRSKRARKIRPNSENNFIFNAIETQHSNLTVDTPTTSICGQEGDDKKTAQKLTDALKFNDKKNKFNKTWKKLVRDFLVSGPTIAMVTWDEGWIGGRGSRRWVGDVRFTRVDKWDFYPDASIINLEDELQDCSYIIRRPRKKLTYIKKRWEERGKYVSEQENEEELRDEGGDANKAYIVEYWHRGQPWYVPEERAKDLRDIANEVQAEEPYRANDLYDMAKGELEGVHVAYYADGVLLEYRPYEYEHGLYPFVFTTRYSDDHQQWGFGEVRNTKIPQVLHNKADEIEIEAMSREGLGGKFYQKGTINPQQLSKIYQNSGKGGMYFEVDNINGMADRDGAKVPASVSNYKEHKQRMIETVSSNTPIQQGMSPGSGVPFATIQELGSRSDVRTKQSSEKLEDFLKEVRMLQIECFAQFYTEDRYYTIQGNDDTVTEDTINREDILQEWERDVQVVEEMNPETGMMEQITVPQIEKFVPEFDINITIVNEKPTDRNYYTNVANELYNRELLSPEHLLYTIDEGKLPDNEEILESLYARQPIMQIMNQLSEVPPEVAKLVNQQIQQVFQQTMQDIMMQSQMMEGGGQSGQMQR